MRDSLATGIADSWATLRKNPPWTCLFLTGITCPKQSPHCYEKLIGVHHERNISEDRCLVNLEMMHLDNLNAYFPDRVKISGQYIYLDET